MTITYVPGSQCIELKSLKYYLLSYRQVGIVQEHAASRILNDLVQACGPRAMTVCLDYTPRGGLHTVVTVRYPPETSGARLVFEELLAWRTRHPLQPNQVIRRLQFQPR